MSDSENNKGVSRRTLLGTTALAASVGLAGGVAFNTDGKGFVTAADAQTKTGTPKAPAARPAVQKTEVAPGELGFGDCLVSLAAGHRGARNNPADETEAAIVGQRLAGRVQQCVLAGPAWSDHANQHYAPAH